MSLQDLTLEITKKCPMKCILCSSNGGEPLPAEFSLSELKNIITQAKSLGVNEISLSGGEPLVYPHVLDLCKYITELKIAVSVYTSGNILDKSGQISPISENYFRKLKNAGANKIVFSLHGSNSKTHDQITGVPKSFENLMFSIRNLQKVGISTTIHFVPLRENFKDLPAIILLVKKMGLKSIHILRFVPQGRGGRYKDILELHPNEILGLRKILADLIEKSDMEIIVGAHYNCLGLGNDKKCTAGINKAVIRPDGFVFPCVGMKRIDSFIDCNNVKHDKLEHIINKSYGFRLLKSLLADAENRSCQHCTGEYSCTNGCIAQRLITNDNSILEKDPHCIQHSEKLTGLLSENNKPSTMMDYKKGVSYAGDY
ncbi:MAG TPA: radical SAM protein [Methanosarcinaceae archaeon]|nr:radical SAM protein [Methanosarcinaceae archaeon]